MPNKIQILSTKNIRGSFIQLAGMNNISIDVINFIETEESISEEIKNRIIQLSHQDVNAVFTSSTAVNAIGKIVKNQATWKIFCIEPGTKKTVGHIFSNSSISGAAMDAEELSRKITEDKCVKQVVFFCGNQRRDFLPSQLRKNGIDVEELIVYKTIEMPQNVSKKYEGILFFSPSAVRSFFSTNDLEEETVIFTIGKTTAEEVKNISNNTTVVSEIPDTKRLIGVVIKYFSAIKTV